MEQRKKMTVSRWHKSVRHVLRNTRVTETTSSPDKMDYSRARLFEVTPHALGDQVENVKFTENGVSVRQADGTLFQVFVKPRTIGDHLAKYSYIPQVMRENGFQDLSVLELVEEYILARVSVHAQSLWDALNQEHLVEKVACPNWESYDFKAGFKETDIVFPCGKIVSVFYNPNEVLLRFEGAKTVLSFSLGETKPFLFYAWGAVPTLLANILNLDASDGQAVKGLEKIEAFYKRQLMLGLRIKCLYKKKHSHVLGKVSEDVALLYYRAYQSLENKTCATALPTTCEVVTRRGSILRAIKF